MRRLLLMRHGESDRDKPGPDFERPLTSRGREASRRMGAWLKARGLVPAAVVSSPAVRARDTALLCAETLGIPADRIAFHACIYEADLDALLAVARDRVPREGGCCWSATTLAWRNLLVHLCPDAPVGRVLPSAAAAMVALPGSEPCRGRCDLENFQRPGAADD